MSIHFSLIIPLACHASSEALKLGIPTNILPPADCLKIVGNFNDKLTDILEAINFFSNESANFITT